MPTHRLTPSSLGEHIRPSRSKPHGLPTGTVLASILLVLALAGCGNGFKFTGDHLDKDNYALKIDPAAPIVTVGHTVHLTATSRWGSGAVWSVLPAAAGAIDANGAFTASMTPTSGTIVAMWKNDVRYTATAILQVVAAPDATITTLTPVMTVNTSDIASVPTQPGSKYVWTVVGGVISTGQNTPQIQFTSATLGSVQITCTVTNAAGDSATGHKSVNVVDLPPAIQYAPATVIRGKPISPIRPVSTGGVPVTWSISPGLLPGLTFDPSTGQISGTPTTLSSAVTYTVTASNSGGSVTATVTITSVDAIPSIVYIPSTFVFTRGAAIPPVVPTVSGAAVTSWSIAPALPAGPAFDPATGIVTGTPTTLSSAVAYTVTASNSGGSATAGLSIRVVDAPPIIHYIPTSQTFVPGTSIGSIQPTNTGGPAISWNITPSLPAGLAFDPATGIITGTPTTPAPTATFTVTASNTGGVSNAVVLTYTVADLAPVFSYTPAAYVLTNSVAIAPIAPTLTAGAAVSWSISAPLPAGLSFDPLTGRISGTPTGLAAAVTYIVTATNINGSSSTAPITLTVLDKPPVIRYSPSAFSLTRGVNFPVLSPTNIGGPAISWTISPGLPAGLAFDTSTGNISGTPTALSASATYTVTASNSGGASNPAILSFAVVDTVPSIGYSPDVFIFIKGQPIAPVLPVNTGGSALSWTLATPLPAGLSFDPSTGRISGTPAALSSATSYTVTASNSGGAGTPLHITISVVDVAPVISYLPAYTFTVGAPISPITPSNTGGAAQTWTIGPALPPGLVFDPATGIITGTPTSPLSPAIYSVTATNSGGASQPVSFTLNLVASATASLSASTLNPLFGASVILTPTFANAATATIGTGRGSSDISRSASNGVGITTSALTSPKTFWLRATDAGGSSLDASVTVTPQTVVIAPITASTNKLSAGSPVTLLTSVTNAVDTSINWTATAGTFAPANTASGANTTWTAPSEPGAYTVTATSAADPTKRVTILLNVVSLPLAASLTASTSTPLFGGTVNLTPTFSSGTGIVDNSIGDVTSGASRTSPALTLPVTYTLTVTNTAGQTATAASPLITPQTVSVDVPVGANLKSTLTAGYTQAYTAAVHGAVVTTVTWTSTGGTWTGSTWTAPLTPGDYTIKATSVADNTKSNSAVITVVNPPVITSFSAADALLSLNHATTLTAVYTNGAGTAVIGATGTGSSDLTSAAVSGAAIATGSLSATRTFTLTVYNEAGDSTSATVTVTVVAGSSSPTAPLSGPRSAHTSTLLPDGRVLIAGGRDDASPLSSSQIFNPSLATFSDAGAMLSARFGHTATLLANNTVLLTGGNNGSTTAQAELWNGAFAATGALGTPREKHTATLLLNGKVLIVGGLDGSSPVVTAELYDPAANTFTYTAGNLNTARYSHTATLLANGKVLLSGGSNGSVALQSAELFDPSTGSFTAVGSMSSPRQRHAAVLLNDGAVAMIGGQGASAPVSSVEIFNPATATFAIAGSLAHARDGLTATLIASGKVIVAGGIDASGSPVQASEIFDPSTAAFGPAALLTTARAGHTATLLQNGQILLVGGLAQAGATSAAEQIDPQDGLTPILPIASVTAPLGAARAQAGLTASVPAQTHVAFVWMITGGAITSGTGTNAVTFTMPATGPATLDVLVTSDRLVPSHTRIAVTPRPVISSFSPARGIVTAGSSTALNWTVQDATSLSIDAGIGAVSGTSTPVTVATLGATIYTLTATNAGGSVTATTTILAVPPPIALSLTAAATSVPVGGNTTLTPIFSQGAGSIDAGLGPVLSGPAYPTAAISAPTTFTLTVTNAAGDIAQRSVSVGLQPIAVTGISGPPFLSTGHTATYTAAVTGTVNTAVAWTADAGAVDASGHLTAPSVAPFSTTQTPLTLTATSVRGGTPASLTVQIVPLPSITSFNSNPSSATYGGSTSITPVFTNGTGQIVGLGSVASGQPVSTGALTAPQTYTLLVTNLAGDSVSQNLTVKQGSLSVTTPNTSSGPIVTTGDVVHFTASTLGSADTSVSWSASGGAFSGSDWTAPVAGTYTVTASSVAPTGFSASASITVVDAPVIASFTAAYTTVAANASTTLQADFTGGAANVSPGAITPVSGASFSSGALSSTTIYNLSVSNSASTPRTVTRSLTINVIKGSTSTLPTPMAFNRVGHTLTLLSTGDVLITGGSSSKTAETFNTSAQTFTQLGSPMQAVRYNHTATLMADGRVLLAGGSDGVAPGNTAEIFDPTSSAFSPTSTVMAQARKNHTAALLPDGRILLSGGVDAAGAALSTSEIYDPVADTFTPAPAISSAREFATATSLQNGSVLLTGGDDVTTSSNIAETFNGAAFTSFSLVQPRSGHTATLLPGGGVLLAGGTSGGSTALASTEAVTGSSSTARADLITARFRHVANLLASGQVFFTGGSADGNIALTSSEILDPTQNQLFATASLGTARFEPASTILRNGNIFIAGGAAAASSAPSSSLNTAELFDPQDSLIPVLPSATLSAPTHASAGATGLTASVPAQANVNFVWSVTNGAITSGLNSRSITFTKGSGGPSVLSVLVISDRQIPVRASATVSTAPSISSFTVTPSTNTTGHSSTLAWTATGASGLTLSIDNGVGDVTALGGSIAVITPAASTTYVLSATDANGATTSSVTLNAIAGPGASSLTAAVNPVERGSSTTILPIFTTNGSATINNIVGPVLSGVAYPTGNLSSSTTFTLTATNTVGTAVTRTLLVNVMPVVVGSISGPADVSIGSSSAQFTTVVTGAVDKTVTWSTSGGAITSAGLLTAPAAAGDIIITATSIADPAQHNQVTVHVGGPPVAAGITAATNPVPYGGSTTITAQFSGGAAVIDQGIGAVTAGVAYTSGAITADKAFNLTVTSPSGVTATTPYIVHPQTVAVSAITGPASGKVTQGHSATFTATVTGAVDTSLTWSSGGAGSFSGSTWTAPANPGIYTITATAINGALNTLSVTAVAAPAVTSFTASPTGVNKNGSSSLSAAFTGARTGSVATAAVTPGALVLSNGGSGVSTGALTATQTYTLTVTNDAGDTATAQTTVQVFLGAFSATSNILTPARDLPTATLRPDGNVLIVGGGNSSNAADVFDSAALSFSSNPATLLTGRSGQTSTLLPNGLILLAGGFNGTAALASAELYNPADGTFTSTAALKQARRNHRAVLLDTGKVLLVGGAALNSAEIFDPLTGAFTLTGSMASAREFATLSRLPDGRVLVAGGLNGSTRLASAEIYDPSTGAFSIAADMLQARALATATNLPDGQILLAGGTGGTATGSAELFNTSLLKFVAAADMIQPRQEHVARLLAGGMVLLAGGNSGLTTNAIDQAELFDPSQGVFLKTDFMSTTGSPSTGSASTLLASGQVLVTGGTGDGSATVAGSELYNPTDGLPAIAADATITAATSVPQASTSIAAHVTAVADARYIWMVSNGTLVSGQGTPSITFNMPATGSATIDVLIVTDRLIPSHGRALVAGNPAPAIASFTASLNPVPFGGSTTLRPVFSNAASAKLGTAGYGSSDISASAASATPITVGPLTTAAAFTLTLPEVAGNQLSSTLTVNVQPVLLSPISPASTSVTAGHTQTFAATVAQAVNTAIVWSATGGVIDPATGLWTAPSTPGAYTIKATAAADNLTSATTSATVVALPSITAFSASPTAINYGQTTSLTPVFTAGAGSQASIAAGSFQITGTAVSGAPISTGALTSTSTFTLTVTNAAGDSAIKSITVTVTQPFSPAGSLALARSGHTTTELPDGSVIIAGGTATASKAEIFTPGTASFTATATSMQAARKHHTATLLADGRILFTGGFDGVTALSSAELFDPATGAFTATTGAMIHARQNHASALLPDGRVLLLGGSDSAGNQLASAEVFDPATGAFTALASTLAEARESATATALPNGDVLVTGGAGPGAAAIASAELFQAGAFGTRSFPMRSARTRHTATLLPSGEVLLSGGFDGFNPLGTAELYTGGSTASSFIPTSGSLATAREQHTATLLAGGKVLLAGGAAGGTPISGAELFDPATQTFVPAGSLGAGRFGAGAALLQTGRVLIVGGTGADAAPLSSAELFQAQDAAVPDLSGFSLSAPASAPFGASQTATLTLPTGAFSVSSIENGTLTSGAGTSTLSFTMGAAGNTTIHVLAFTTLGLPLHADRVVTGH